LECDKRQKSSSTFALFFWANRIEIFRSFKIPEVSELFKIFNFFATELPKNLQTFLHSDNPEFLGSSFSLSRHRERETQRERERERERDKEIER
jgi:hypothetical protein